MVRYHMRLFNDGCGAKAATTCQMKSLLVIPGCRYIITIPKAHGVAMALEINSMLVEETVEVGYGNKGFFTYPSIIHR